MIPGPTPPVYEPTASDPLAGQMRQTFDELQRAGVPYVVLRGFRPIAELAESVDVDVFIPRQALPQAAVALARAGWSRRRHQVERFPHVFFDSWAGPVGLVRSLDVVTDLCYGDALKTLRGAEGITQRSEELEGVRVPEAWDAAFTFALHVALDKGELSPANTRRARELSAACERVPAGRARLARSFGEDAARFVDVFLSLRAAHGTSGIGALADEASRLSALRPRPLLARWDRVRRRAVQLRRPVARVAIFGIDGSGKSTIVSTFQTAPSTLRVGSGYLGSNFFRTPPTRWMHSWLVARREAGDESSVAYRVVANLFTLWWPAELVARVMIAEHTSELVLYDRFPLGQDAGHPTTVWGALVAAYVRFGDRLLPRPDLVILLDGDDRVIWERKRESTFEVHQRTQASYRSLLARLPGETTRVLTDRSPAESIAAVKHALAASPAIRRKLYGA